MWDVAMVIRKGWTCEAVWVQTVNERANERVNETA